MRTFSAPAWVVRPASARAKRFWLFEAAFEILVFDKMPFVPDRTTPAQLLGRVVSGSACAVYASPAEQRTFERVQAGVMGGVAAVVAAYAARNLRRRVGARLGLPDAVVGGAEDAVTIGLGKLLTA